MGKIRRAPLIIAIVTAVFFVSGCSTPTLTPVAEEQQRPPSPSPSGSAEPSPSPAPEPSPSAPDDDLTCEKLLDADTRAKIDADPEFDYVPEFADRVSSEDQNLLRYFVDLDGLACLAGYPDGDTSFSWGYSTIDAATAATVQAELVSQGFTTGVTPSGTLYSAPAEWGAEYAFLFTGPEWYHSSIESLLPAIVAQSHAA